MPSPVPELKQLRSTKQRAGMLMFRLICAFVVAWAVNWVMGQPVADNLLELVPEMEYIAPLAGAIVGFVALATRQGWGVIVAVANGLWTMLLTIAGSWLIFLTLKLSDHILHGLIANFEHFLRILGSEAQPLAEGWIDLRLLGMTLAATVVAGLITEFLHWLLVWLRRTRGDEEEEEGTERA